MKIATLLLAVTLACSAVKPTVSKPSTATIETDAGAKICEYVTVSAQGRAAQVGVCAADDSELRLVVDALEGAYPFAVELIK